VISSLLLSCAVGYLIGAVPFGVMATRSQGIDIFQFGSGNPGATNVARALGKKWGIAIFLLDVLKGVIPALLARAMVPSPVGGVPAQVLWFAVGICAVLGHCFSVFLRFRGGKGIATLLGAGIGACPLVAGAGFGIFLLVFAVTRYVSLASIVAVPSAAIFGWLIPGQARELVAVYLLLTVFVVYRHRSNIGRLMAGTEPKFKAGTSPKAKDQPDVSPEESTTERSLPKVTSDGAP
jgi:acyl phosphate:glycerol-3-phosphate acyltransferase